MLHSEVFGYLQPSSFASLCSLYIYTHSYIHYDRHVLETWTGEGHNLSNSCRRKSSFRPHSLQSSFINRREAKTSATLALSKLQLGKDSRHKHEGVKYLEKQVTYPYFRGVDSSSCLGLSVACVPGQHVRHTRRFVQIVGHASRPPVCTQEIRTLRCSQIRFAHSRTPVGDASSSRRCASTSVCSFLRYRTTSA